MIHQVICQYVSVVLSALLSAIVDFITSSTDKYYSLDSEDDFRSGCRNVSHQQQFFSELHCTLTRMITQYELFIICVYKKSFYTVLCTCTLMFSLVDCMVPSCSSHGHIIHFYPCSCTCSSHLPMEEMILENMNFHGKRKTGITKTVMIYNYWHVFCKHLAQYSQNQNNKLSLVLIFWQIAREMQQTMDEMGRSAFPVRPGETFHMAVSYSAYWRLKINITSSRFSYMYTVY